jgi:hypothetical protein
LISTKKYKISRTVFDQNFQQNTIPPKKKGNLFLSFPTDFTWENKESSFIFKGWKIRNKKSCKKKKIIYIVLKIQGYIFGERLFKKNGFVKSTQNESKNLINLRDYIFDELTEMGKCRVIHSRWQFVKWSRLIVFATDNIFIAVGRGKFGDRFKYSKDKRSCNPNCKLGCSVISSVHHFFF